MCGIIGYTGYSKARGILLKGLKTLEYRGYDSAGIAVWNNEKNETAVTKAAGRVNNLVGKSSETGSTCGIGHTRWATHGGVSDANSHPHKFGAVTLVHNGIIENYTAIANQIGVNESLKSSTDSEVIAALINNYFDGSNPIEAITKAAKELCGTFALGIMFDGIADTIFAVRNVSPIVCCSGSDGAYIASDILAIGEYSDNYFVLPEFSVAQIKKDSIEILDFDGKAVEPEIKHRSKSEYVTGKQGFPFFMEKEISEQPDVIKKTIDKRISCGLPNFGCDDIDENIFADCSDITVIACGTAMHAGLIGKQLVEKICRIPVNVCMASEYTYSDPIISDKTLVICISQSGETIDTLGALQYAKKAGAKTLSIVNVPSSTIARESENVIYTDAGPEVAVASTKAYTTQAAILYLITAKTALMRGMMSEDEARKFVIELQRIPQAAAQVISRKDEIHHLSNALLTAEHTFMIGRGMDYPTLLEASLKLKEISYIHCEAFASGELKHGTIALITDNTPVIALITQSALVYKQLSNIREVQSRGANVITIAKSSLLGDRECSFSLPELKDEFMPIPTMCALQLLAYYVSSDKGLDVDKPRNLAKVVTVE